jgi:uncharacterized protein YeaO (DUF488 family)
MIRTRRWNDLAEPGDGLRVLVCRYRPRGVAAADETWDEWWKALAPTPELHAAAYGKGQEAIAWDEYRRRFLIEMDAAAPRFHLRALRNRVAAGETVTLLCSSACVDEARCHRSILKQILEAAGR